LCGRAADALDSSRFDALENRRLIDELRKAAE
jgi:hypothetical protein